MKPNWLIRGMRTEETSLEKANTYLFFSSTQEGSLNALLEALACGIACLGSRIPEIGEILYYDELLFDLSSPHQLAGYIQKAGTDPDYLQRLTQLARRRREIFKFNWQERAVQYVTEEGRPL